MLPVQHNLKQKQAFITFGRGFSIFAIVLYHILGVTILPGYLSKANQIGGAGIYFFLFASGYGLYSSNPDKPHHFLKKRFVKVILPYYLAITLIFCINIFSHSYNEGWKEYLSHIFFYKMFSDKYIYSFGYHFWFISTIIQFYILYPLLIYLIKATSSTSVLLGSIVISITYSVIIILTQNSGNGVFQRFVLQYLWLLMLGMVVAKHNLLQSMLAYSLLNYFICTVISLAIAVGIERYTNTGLLNDIFIFAAFTSITIINYQVSNRIPLIRRLILWIESFSYSLYLLHIFVLVLYMKMISVTNIRVFEVPIVLAITCVSCIAYNRISGKIISMLTGVPKVHAGGVDDEKLIPAWEVEKITFK